jgi:cytochrome b subunit of formate dehydrogenase
MTSDGSRSRGRRAALLVSLALAAAAPAPARAQEACLECHDDPAVAAVAGSVHEFLGCTDCHAGADSADHPDGMTPPTAACADCHDDAVGDFAASIHAAVAEEEGGWFDGCASCHGPIHELAGAADPASPIHPSRLADTCGGCHADPRMAERSAFRRLQPLEAYRASVHALAIAGGDGGATCSSCHGAHRILPATDPESSVARMRVPETCGGCHGEIAEAFAASIHGLAAAGGVSDSPVCTDCHGEHRILSPEEPGSPVFATNIPRMTCGRCHGDLRLAERFDLPSDRLPAFEDSYHGLASRAGRTTVAHCGSCHGIHDIQPSTDPASKTHPGNLAATCGQCHAGAGTVFAIGPVHVVSTAPEHAAVYWVRRIYLWLIALLIGGMVLHNALDLYRKARLGPALHRARAGETTRQRLSAPMRIAHALLAVSFIVLAYTGFALKYPEAWWAQPLRVGEGGLDLRALIHRWAAVAMLGAGAFHVVHLAVSRRARRFIAGMIPGRSDLRELRDRLAFLSGRRRDLPPAPWIGYPEKIEYLAVLWGTVLMALTGFLLWFESATLRWLPSWTLDLATVIHFYEAILASLAILVWHFYSVIFDPMVYPMDPAWLTGRPALGRDHERVPPPDAN